MSFPVTVGLSFGDQTVASTTDHGRALGTRGVLPDGRVFYWSQAGGVALEAGKIMQTKVAHGSSIHAVGLTVENVGTTGVSTLSIVIATTPTTKDFYKDGYVMVDTSATNATGMIYRIKSHPAVASAATGVFTLDEPIRQPMTSGTNLVGLRENPYTSVIATPASTLTGLAIGVAPINVAIASFFWLQTFGPCALDCDLALIAGVPVVVPAASAGTATVATSVLTNAVLQIVGHAQTAAAGADTYAYVFLSIRA